jgi:hypothetical protein
VREGIGTVAARLATLLLLLVPSLAGTAGAHPGRGIQVDGRGRVWFVDTVRDILWRIDGGVLVPVARGVHSDRLLLAGDSAVTAEDYFAALIGPRLVQLGRDSTRSFRDGAMRLAADPASFVALDAAGNAYFVLAGHLLVLTPADSLIERAHGLPVALPLAAAVRSDGVVYLVIENRVWQLAPNRGTAPLVSDSAAYTFVSGVAVGDSGRLCVADYLGRRVYSYHGDAGVARGVRWPWYPVGVAAGPDGSCYVLERRFRYGGIAGALDWAVDLMGTPRVRRVDASGRAEVVAVVGHPGAVLPILTLGAAVVAILLLRRRARRSSRAHA